MSANKLTVAQLATIGVAVNGGPVNAGVQFQVPESQQEVIEVNRYGIVTAKGPGAAVVLAHDPQAILVDAPIFVVRKTAQAQYEEDVRNGLVKPRTVFSPL
jgi:hypothetical protein